MAQEELRPSPAQIRLNAIRSRHASASPAWEIAFGETITVRAGEVGDLPEVCTFTAGVFVDDRELITHAHEDIAWLLAAYERLAAKYRDALAEINRTAQSRNVRDFAAECAMQSGKQAFRTFLRERHSLEATDDERVNARVRSILAIQSRAELNTDGSARQRWFSLRAEFKNWQEGRV
ncbi:hypothetical protein [Shinella zoogloeoides]|uniref:hypothetical protein n=1 Tax=Shinella zoogloeoides TaxID=352475 RepID=UPI001F5762DF|nr:hypothetical protein [Shinella zoogloeoides]